MECAYQPWLNSAQALGKLQGLTGVALTREQLRELCASEVCRSHVDCSFAAGPAPDDQLFVRKIRGAGYCELLDADDITSFVPNGDQAPLLGVKGALVVRGCAWVYSSEGPRPGRENGIWRISLGELCRPLYFAPADIQALAARLASGEPLPARQRNRRH